MAARTPAARTPAARTPAAQTPEWVKHAIFYQIFPDRFARSQRTQHPRGIQFKPWGSPPAEQGFQGGDLYGIVEKLDYLADLGITALYLNPIFSSASNHRYHTFDYYEVDPLLGGNAALRELLDAAHGRGMRVVLDGVFNHASRGFWAFHHILENGGNSPYLDWFHVFDWPLRPYSSNKTDRPANYAAWWSEPALPKFNTDNPGVRDYIMDVARYWIDFGIDGWRLDVPAEIDDDDFWQEFRRVVKAANPEAYIVGEIWNEARRWLQGDQFDAVMNYIFCWSVLSYAIVPQKQRPYTHDLLDFSPRDGAQLAAVLDEMHRLYDWPVTCAQLNLLDSHDMPRALWLAGDDRSALEMGLLFQMTLPGAPCIYYGDEVGLSGSDDPECRRAFPWHEPASWDQDLLAFYKRATALRHAHPVLRTGRYQTLHGAGPLFAFHRELDGATAVVAFNQSARSHEITLSVPAGAVFKPVWPAEGAAISAAGGQLTVAVPARGGVVLIGEKAGQ